MNLRYGAEALGLLFIAVALMKWVGRNVRSQISDVDTADDARLVDGLGDMASMRAAGMLQRRGLVTSAQLAAMSPRERLLLFSSTRHLEGTGVEVVVDTVQERRVPERPLPSAIHCPACGASLDRQRIVTYGETRCSGCERRVIARVQRHRLEVAVEDDAADNEGMTATG